MISIMGLARTMARTAVISGTATATANAVNRRQAKKNVAAVQSAQQTVAAEQTAAPVAQAPVDDTAQQLANLKSMMDQGLITAEDYEAKKKQILGL